MLDHRSRPQPSRGALGVAAALLVACLLAASPLLLYRSVAAVTQSQQQVLQQLQEALGAMQVERDAARSQLEDVKTQLAEVQGTLEDKVEILQATEAGLHDWTEEIKFDLDKHRRQFSPSDKISEQPATAIVRIDSKGQFVASPSIVSLPTGRLLVVLERAVTWGVTRETTMKLIYSSDDGGSSWQRAAMVGPMNWPQLFRCASGTYLLGTERHFSRDNNLVISKMLDDQGNEWSAPTRLTQGLSVVSANNGVDVSGGRVTKALELIPSMATPVAATVLKQDVLVDAGGGVGGPSWEHQPVMDLSVGSTAGFVQYTLVKVPYGDKAVFFRIVSIDPAARIIRARLERFNLYWVQQPVVLPSNSTLQVASGALVYGGVDWVATAISADERADLRDPAAWKIAAGVGNPASMYSHEMRALFDAAFRGDASVRKSIIGFDVPGLNTSSAWEAGFGSLYWMEGVVTRQQDRHGGNGKLLSIMRVNNDMLCDLAALVEYDDSQLRGSGGGKEGEAPEAAAAQDAQLTGRFLRYAFVPGLGVGHPAILYDEVSDLYWMVSNVNRDSNRSWKQPARPNGTSPALHITAFSKCEVDRTTLALYYSSNLVSWTLAGMVDYHINLGRHFAYPHMTVEGRDLLVVSRAAFAPWARSADAPLNDYYNNHNSNTIAFHRVRNFRHYANIEWAREQGQYSHHPRRTAMKDEVEAEGTAFAAQVAERKAAADAAAARDAAAAAAAAADLAAAQGQQPGAAAAAAGSGGVAGDQLPQLKGPEPGLPAAQQAAGQQQQPPQQRDTAAAPAAAAAAVEQQQQQKG